MERPREDWMAVMEALQKGDGVALVKVTRLITGFLARYRAYEHRDAWDDLCQDVLTRLIRSVRRGAIRNPGAFVSYTGTITRNRLLDWIEKQQRAGAPDRVGDPEAAEALPSGPHRHPEAEDLELRVDLDRALASLPEKQRHVVEAIYLQGMSYEEAATRLAMPLGSLKRMQTQGLKELRVQLGFAGGGVA